MIEWLFRVHTQMFLHGLSRFRHYGIDKAGYDSKGFKKVINYNFKLFSARFFLCKYPGRGKINILVHMADKFPDGHERLMKSKHFHIFFVSFNGLQCIRFQSEPKFLFDPGIDLWNDS